jgi:hypothetical protein
MKKFLKSQGNPDAQGSGNAPTPQECAFAKLLENNAFKFLPKGTPVPTVDGKYYFYQFQNTQRSIDFVVVIIDSGKGTTYYFDLKHSNTKSFYFNDGWFENGVIYVISFTIKKINKVYIGYGQDTRTEKDDLAYKSVRKFIKENNAILKDTEFLRIYLRLANQYSCNQFTQEFIDEKFKSIQTKVSLTPLTS